MVQDYSKTSSLHRSRRTGDRLAVGQDVDIKHRRNAANGSRPPLNIYVSNPLSYFVAVEHENGATEYHVGPSAGAAVSEAELSSFFNKAAFQVYMNRRRLRTDALDADQSFTGGNEYETQAVERSQPARRPYDRRSSQVYDAFPNDTPYKRRKAQKPSARTREIQDDDDPPAVIKPLRRGIKIGNSKEVSNYYDQQFRNCQQILCKIISKAWVKALEPKKQTNYPYTGSTAPPWWPKPWGPDKHQQVRFREPDHLLKDERIHLLNHILRLVVEPDSVNRLNRLRLEDHPTADTKTPLLDVAKLEEVAMEALAPLFSDRNNDNHAKKKPYLREIFKLARKEEQFRNGEIDGVTEIFVMTIDAVPDKYLSESDESDLLTSVKDERENMISPITADGTAQNPIRSHDLVRTSGGDQNSTGILHASSFINPLPVRTSEYIPTTIQPHLGLDQHPYVGDVDTMAIGTQSQLQTHTGLSMTSNLSSHHEGGPGTPLYDSTSSFPADSGSTIYQGSWQPGTVASSGTSMYAYTSHPPHNPPQQQQQRVAQGSFGRLPSRTISHGNPYMTTSFDGLTRPCDSHPPPSLFRPSSTVHHGGIVAQRQSYQAYLNEGSKMEEMDATQL